MNTANLCHLLNPKESNGHILYFKETPRRLSSGSACETCRRRKTKCDGGQPCAFCKSNGIQCLRRANKRSTSKAGKKIYRLKNTRRSYTSSTIRNIETASNSSSESSPTYSHDSFSWLNDIEYKKTVRAQVISDKNSKIPSMLDQLSCHTFTMKTDYGKQHFLKALE